MAHARILSSAFVGRAVQVDTITATCKLPVVSTL